jgi:uncharacterized protein with ATP-grasp and redox domains
MNIQYECIPCSINNYIRLVKSNMIPENLQEDILRKLLDFFSRVDYNQSPPALGQQLHRLLRKYLHNPDPYCEVKLEFNRRMLERYEEFKKIINDSSHPFLTAVRLAIAGNVIDFGSFHRLEVMGTVERVLKAELARDDSLKLKQEIAKADTVLYLGDNAGEIVFDKLLIETMNHPKVFFAVRGTPIINDITEQDAKMIGIDEYAKIVSTGDDAPGILLESCSPEFTKIFHQADVVISKGQGNLEGLIDVDQNIFYLLTVKCKLIAEHLGVKEKEFVVFGGSCPHKKNSDVALSTKERDS